LPGLLAAGEVSASGLHGANRLGSNSLLEGLVVGRQAGRLASQGALEIEDSFRAVPLNSDWPQPEPDEEELNISDIENSLNSLMWRNVGISRHDDGLQQAMTQLEFWERYVSQREFASIEGWELQNQLLVARLMAAAALERRESRGVHARSDFPEMSAEFASHCNVAVESTKEVTVLNDGRF
jgi:L-aspartate oxidase